MTRTITLAAIDLGFTTDQAERIVRQTVVGASGLLESPGQSPRALRGAVTSKGGTTAAAIEKLDKAKVVQAVLAAIHAARDRGRELGGTP